MAPTLLAALTLALGVAGLPAEASAAPRTFATGALSLAALAPGDRVPRTPAGDVALTWAPLYMSDHHEYSRDQALRMARRFDLITAMPYGLSNHAAAMRNANPDLNLLAYSNGTLAAPDAVGGLPESAFAHSMTGARIRATGWNTYLMEPTSPQWRAAANKQCVDRSALGGLDGCLVDMLTLGIFARGFVTALPKNPATGLLYTEAQYRDQLAALAADLRARSPQLVQIGNMVENSYRYWQSDVTSRPLVASGPGAQMEDFLRGAQDGTGDWPSATDWKRNVDVITDMEATGKVGLFTTKLWSGASSAASAQWQAYAMASFLMGADGSSFFAFTRSRDQSGASQTNAPYTMPDGLGMPRGPMRRLSSGAWIRDFANGVSVVNPGSSPVRVSLPVPMRGLDGSWRSSMTLAPHSGDVLLRSESSPLRLQIKKIRGSAWLKPNRWTRIKAVVANRGGRTVPRGTVRAAGHPLKARRHHIRALKPGRSAEVGLAVKLVRHSGGRVRVRLIYSAGGKRDVARVLVRVARR